MSGWWERDSPATWAEVRRLVKDATELLAALRKLATEAHAVLLCDPNLNAAIEEAEAVIAKAEGKADDARDHD